jgi:hypothetical protein
VLVRYMELYKEDLEVQLPLIEALHRIFSLPLCCWLHAIKSRDANNNTSSSAHGGEEPLPAAVRRALHTSPQMQADNEANSKTTALERVPLDPAMSFSSLCSPSRRMQRYKYQRSGDSDGWLCIRPLLGEHVLEGACDVCVPALLRMVAAQSTEIVLLRAVLAVLLAITRLVGDGRYLHSICETVSTRLRTPVVCSPMLTQSPQHLQILSNEIADEMTPPSSAAASATSRRAGVLQPEQLFTSSGLARTRAHLMHLTVDTSIEAEEEAPLENGDNDESDWDDWSEDEDVAAVERFVHAFTCFPGVVLDTLLYAYFSFFKLLGKSSSTSHTMYLPAYMYVHINAHMHILTTTEISNSDPGVP